MRPNKCPDHGWPNVHRVPTYRNKGAGRVIGRGEAGGGAGEGQAGGEASSSGRSLPRLTCSSRAAIALQLTQEKSSG